MSHMTNAQIDELNMLLAEHEAALIAFYKEGMDQGAKNGNRSRLFSGSFLFYLLHRPS